MSAVPSVGTPLGWNAAEPGAVGRNATKEQIHQTAVQFEALLAGQIFASMRESGGGWLGGGEDQAGATMVEFAEQHLAQVLAEQGGFGLARLIEQGLARNSVPAAGVAPSDGAAPAAGAAQPQKLSDDNSVRS